MIKDDLRRAFLTKALRFGGVLALTPILPKSVLAKDDFAKDDFDRYKSGMNAGLFKVKDEFAQYKKAYAQAYREYQNEIAQFWVEVELSSRTSWVDYDSTMNIKRVVDFANNEIRISVQGDKLQGFSPKDSEREILAALSMDIGAAYKDDPVLAKIVGDQQPNSQRKILGLDKSLASSLNKAAVLKRQQGKKGELLTIIAKLPANSLAIRAESFLPSVEASALKWQVPAALIMAIMHTESAFNPLARSHIPAFGLMQIVPKSAGRDASRLVFGEERLLVGRDLYEPETNIEMGAAYLHILDRKYLKGITDDKSRQLCVVAAYNTGAGNVAYAFAGTTSVKKALPLINRLSSQQVYAHLRSQLKYQEARNYLQKVTKALPLYA
ncbi:Lytic transglycosylase catalytic [Oleispira antarctica RB-8]|uniref:Lytic transglycosylase catalytic n=1 Tax=Oleispira antarctica RB-8 TaxID=698738 RepID=R4YMC2_OLEAN|nr:Lytic transglycosylase catalytic [Oleispira antarctica RB-8]